MTHPWHQLEGETNGAYAAFLAYIELGQRRTLSATHAKISKPGASKRGVGSCGKWSRAHNWKQRAAAFDSHELRERVDAWQETRDRARQVFIDEAVEAAHRLVRVARGDEGLDPMTGGREQLSALKDILDRAGLAAPKETKVNLGASGPATITVKIGGGK